MTEPVIIGNATLYLGDCRDVLPTLDKVDAVVTAVCVRRPLVLSVFHGKTQRFSSRQGGGISRLRGFDLEGPHSVSQRTGFAVRRDSGCGRQSFAGVGENHAGDEVGFSAQGNAHACIPLPHQAMR